MNEGARLAHVHDNVPDAIYIGRNMPRSAVWRGIWGNPYVIGRDGTRQEVIAKYRDYLLSTPGLLRQLPQLRGKTLACWCRRLHETATTENRCHGDVIRQLLWANNDEQLEQLAQRAERQKERARGL